ncbi:protein N-terminal glutamine amidohydrolase [Pelomyxa schiedti]|nr:protein N-terminal glutamine amidohydrolase [Pelomyxa schiedti]
MDKSQFVYTKYYCEENVYMFLRKQQDRCPGPNVSRNMYAVLVSNANQTVPFWGTNSRDPVIWDYHVFSVGTGSQKGPLVYDFDGGVQFPCPLADYIRTVLRPELRLPPIFQRKFRIVQDSDFLNTFSSDRSHMIKNGRYTQPPPPYPPIQADGQPSTNLMKMIDMNDTWLGTIVDNLTDFFSL